MFKVHFFADGRMIENVLTFKSYAEAYKYGHSNYGWTRWIIIKV
jgi:hypothetical protein